MNILQNRIDSFKNNTVKWPHTDKQHYRTETFAKAGLYFTRRPKASDSVRCFLCDVEMNNWKPGQSPFSRHSKESPSCAWTCLSYPDVNQKPLTVDNRDPTTQPRGPKMRTARLATFSNHNFWPPNKSMLNKNKKYPPASKLADAGFYYSPTSEQAARIKCPYCRLVIVEPEKNTNMLDKHQELSSECAFFIPTHNMRATRSRRDTVDSTKSNDTFTTAASALEEEESPKPTKRKLEESKSRKTPEPRTKNDSVTPATKRKRELATNKNPPKIITKSEFTVQPAKSAKRKEPEPPKTIKIVKRKKSADPLPTIKDAQPSATKRRHEEPKDSSVSKQRKTEKVQDNFEEDSFWNIEKTFAPSTNVRRSAVTFGGKSRPRISATRQVEPSSVDIFANLKPSLIVKPGDSKRPSTDAPKPLEQNKSSLNAPNPFKPVNVKFVSRPSTDLSEDNKPVVSSTTKKRNLTTKSAAISTSATSSIKDLPLKVIVDTRQLSSSSSSVSFSIKSQKSTITDTPISTENVEPVIPVTKPYRDKGKGRAVEYNLTPTTVKKPISLSKSKNKGSAAESTVKPSEFPVCPWVVPTTSSSSTNPCSEDNFDKRSSSSSFATATSSKSQASSTSKLRLGPNASSIFSGSSAGALQNPFSSALLSSSKSNIPNAHEELVSVTKNKKSVPSSKEQDDTSSKDKEKVDTSSKDKEKIDTSSKDKGKVDTSSKDKEKVDTSEKSKEVPPSQTIGGSPPPLLRRTPSPILQRSPSPVLTPTHRTPSPTPPQSSRNKTPPPPSPKSTAQRMMFMQSTPTQYIQRMKFMQSTPTEGAQNRMVSAFDIFGDCPLSPINPVNKPIDNVLQDTPVIHQSGRTRNVILQEENGTPQRIRKSSPLKSPTSCEPSTIPAALDINTIFPVESVSEEQKKMKVEDYLQHVIEKNIEKVREHGLKKIQEIEETSDRIKAALQYSAGMHD